MILAISLCLVFSRAMFTTYKNEKVMTMDGNLYLLQYGSYISRDVMEENIKKLDNYLIYEEDNKYYVFVGAYTNLENAYIMQKEMEERGIFTYLKNDYYGNSDKLSKIEELEHKLIETEKYEEKEKLNKEILEILKR